MDVNEEAMEVVVFGRIEYEGWHCRTSGGHQALFQKDSSFLNFTLSPQNALKALRDPTFDWIIFLWQHAKPFLASYTEESHSSWKEIQL